MAHLSERDGTSTGPQRSFLRRLVNEAFVVGYPGYRLDDRPAARYLPDSNHLDRLSMAEASQAIEKLRAAKNAGWPDSRTARAKGTK